MRLIDADALKKSIDECDICNVCPERKVRCSYDCDFPDFLSPKYEALIDAQPTIEAVPKDFHDKTCEAMAKRHTEEIQRLMPKRGEWKLFYESKDGDNVYECSCCRFITVIPEGIKLFSFCPNCGCAMTKESE